MKIKNRHFLYLLPRVPRKKDPVKCSKCEHIIQRGDLTYTKPNCKYYCAECSFTLGFIKGVE